MARNYVNTSNILFTEYKLWANIKQVFSIFSYIFCFSFFFSFFLSISNECHIQNVNVLSTGRSESQQSTYNTRMYFKLIYWIISMSGFCKFASLKQANAHFFFNLGIGIFVYAKKKKTKLNPDPPATAEANEEEKYEGNQSQVQKHKQHTPFSTWTQTKTIRCLQVNFPNPITLFKCEYLTLVQIHRKINIGCRENVFFFTGGGELESH